MKRNNRILTLAVALVWATTFRLAFAADVLPEFAFHEINLKFAQADGKPVSGASIYGFCRELNLIWPRRDHELEGRNDVLWDESFLGKTDTNGIVKVIVPPGKWGFFALGKTGGAQGIIVAGWSDFSERSIGDTVRLAPAATKHWVLSSTNATFAAQRIFLKPEGFPIWIPADLASSSDSLQMELPAGQFQMWAEGDATADHPGFVMNWGILSSQMADGKIFTPDKTAVVECKRGKGKVSLRWVRRQNFGLEGGLNLCNDATVLLTPGMFSLAYSRPIAPELMGNFIGLLYNLREGRPVLLNMETPLNAGLDQGLSEPNKKGQSKLNGQLYLVDGNGHILNELSDAIHKPVNLDATVTLNGERFEAHPVLRSVETPDAEEKGEEDEDSTMGQMLFATRGGSFHSDAGAIWEFTAPPGVLTQSRFTKSERITVTSATFKMEVPRAIEQPAQNLLAQAEVLAEVMKNISGRTRRVNVTSINIEPGKRGASAALSGSRIRFGTRLFFYDTPMWGHTIVHEMGHNFGFHHGGLHETVVETSRCAGAEQISQQPAKWMFLDRMNGIPTKEVPPHYPNKGLYLYCYAQGGLNFLHFMSANEYAVIGKLSKEGYTTDELTAALLNLALGRDMTRICSNYGLNITPERVMQATQAARVLCRN